MGGDEFLVVREGVGREKFQESVEQLKAAAVSSRCWLSIGSALGVRPAEKASMT